MEQKLTFWGQYEVFGRISQSGDSAASLKKFWDECVLSRCNIILKADVYTKPDGGTSETWVAFALGGKLLKVTLPLVFSVCQTFLRSNSF